MKKEKGINPFHEINKNRFLDSSAKKERTKERRQVIANNHNNVFNIIIQSSAIKL